MISSSLPMTRATGNAFCMHLVQICCSCPFKFRKAGGTREVVCVSSILNPQGIYFSFEEKKKKNRLTRTPQNFKKASFEIVSKYMKGQNHILEF